MAKKTISRLSVLAVLIVFLAACSKTSEYTNVIPADASAVASINLKSLASKAGLDDKENEAAKQKVLEALKSGMNAATFQQLEKVMKNPGESGIDVKKDFFFFAAMEGTVDAPVMRGGLLLPIGDKAKFDALLARINEKSGVTPETKGGVKRAMPAFCAPTTTSRSWSISCRTALTIWPATCASCSPRRAARA